MVAETCFPVKVSLGHVREMIGHTRYLFLPTLIDMPTPDPSEKGFYCPLVQGNSYMARAALEIDPAALLALTLLSLLGLLGLLGLLRLLPLLLSVLRLLLSPPPRSWMYLRGVLGTDNCPLGD